MSVPGRREVLERVFRVLAAECGCDASALKREALTFTRLPVEPAGRRYPQRSDPFIVTAGRGAVIAASEQHLEWLHDEFGKSDREQMFAATTIAGISRYLEPHGRSLVGPDLKYTCAPADLVQQEVDLEIVLYEGEAVRDLYRFRGFDNALQYDLDHPQPDVLATVLMRDGEPVAMAGASADADDLWQIGVDVLPRFRTGGVGAALVHRLALAIFECGKVPFYSTSPSNIASRRLARRVGFWPAWIELRTTDGARSTS